MVVPTTFGAAFNLCISFLSIQLLFGLSRYKGHAVRHCIRSNVIEMHLDGLRVAVAWTSLGVREYLTFHQDESLYIYVHFLFGSGNVRTHDILCDVRPLKSQMPVKNCPSRWNFHDWVKQ